MKKYAVLVFAVLALGFAFLLHGPSVSAKAAPDEALIGVINASDTTIYRLAGEKPVFLNFWASWCPHCVREMPAIEEMYKKYGDRLHFAAVSVDDEKGAAAAFVQQQGLTLPVYTGDLSKIGIEYNLDAIPRSVLVGKDGSIIADHSGAMSAAELEAFLAKAL
ncbi:MAG: TlpA family protein disulfide reductase [Schwartzia sp.]|nr:TlpA family protein disulfide reductase [Schwartzia sp. (in: firmicutes)]